MSTKHHERHTEVSPREHAAAAETPAPAAPETPQADQSAELEALRARVAALEAREAALVEENSSLKDQYLRKLADYENFRKRMFRERDESLKYANAGLLGDLVPVLDDFDRAVASAEHAQDYATLHDGVVLIRRQLGQTLESKYGLTRLECVGAIFDPNIHEAIAAEPGPVSEPTVVEEFLPGYKLHDRVVRSAKVRVQMPAPAPGEGATPATAAELGPPSAGEDAAVTTN